MKNIEVLIVGRGKLAEELLQGIKSPIVMNVLQWNERVSLKGEKCIVVHAGSGRELDDVIEYCNKTKSTLLDLSTGDSILPETPLFPIIVCPNVNLQMLYFMAMVKQASKYFKGQNIKITESHQSSKSTKPGTALYLANSLGIKEKDIKSIRDPESQKEIGISSQFIDRHAYHQILINQGDVEIKMETKVLGKSAYASGLSEIINNIAGKGIVDPGKYDIVDFII